MNIWIYACPNMTCSDNRGVQIIEVPIIEVGLYFENIHSQCLIVESMTRAACDSPIFGKTWETTISLLQKKQLTEECHQSTCLQWTLSRCIYKLHKSCLKRYKNLTTKPGSEMVSFFIKHSKTLKISIHCIFGFSGVKRILILHISGSVTGQSMTIITVTWQK